MKRIYIFCGNLGSGKTELAINFSLQLPSPVYLCDLDFVNPYFRSREKKQELEQLGIISSAPIAEYADIPSISAEVERAILNENASVVLDIGGDDKGARVIGTLLPSIKKFPLEMFLILNPFRPETSTYTGTSNIIHSIQTAARLNFTSIILNPHLSYQTTIKNIIEGIQIVENWNLSLTIKYVAIEKRFKHEVKSNFKTFKNYKILWIKRFMLNPWEL